MNETLRKASKSQLQLVVCLLGGLIVTTSCYGQDPKPSAVAGVENTRMGAYRALAQLSFEAFKGGDKALAAKLARILERTWDRAEEGSGNRTLETTNPTLFKRIDQAMDLFIKPIIAYEKTTPDPVKIEAAFDEYIRLRPESCWNDCLTRRKLIRLCVPSYVAYEVGAARQQTVRSPRTMDPHSQEWHRNREATVYLPA